MDGGGRGKAGSRVPPRNHDLWSRGSYWEFERATDALRLAATRNGKLRPRYGWFWAVYVERRYGGAKGLRLEPHEQAHADVGLDKVTRLMPENIFVPIEISANGGVPMAMAVSAAFPWERREERAA